MKEFSAVFKTVFHLIPFLTFTELFFLDGGMSGRRVSGSSCFMSALSAA